MCSKRSTFELDVTVLYTVRVRINILLIMSGRLPSHEESSFKVVRFCWYKEDFKEGMVMPSGLGSIYSSRMLFCGRKLFLLVESCPKNDPGAHLRWSKVIAIKNFLLSPNKVVEMIRSRCYVPFYLKYLFFVKSIVQGETRCYYVRRSTFLKRKNEWISCW